MNSFYRAKTKRLFDVLSTSIAIVLLMPLLFAVALVVYFKLGWPILFQQTRAGWCGRLFTIYKFRTMTNDVDKHGNLRPDSERLTSFGKWLRTTSLDELPELWNVLIGDMSIVGPRPLLTKYLPLYSSHQQRRHEVRPGLTGLAQINGRNQSSWKERLNYDVQYVDNHNLKLDFSIIFKTVSIVLSRQGISAVGDATMPNFCGDKVEDAHIEETRLKQNAVRWPDFSDEEVSAVSAVLKSGKVNYWTGVEVKTFESEYANFLGVKHAIAVANGTVALELAIRSLGIGPGDEVVVPSKTFIATASAVVACGAAVVTADIDPETHNLTAKTILDALSPNTRAVICVHLGGLPCEMNEILNVVHANNLYLVEDCAQAHGATYKNKPVGTLGHINTFSFCQDKIISTGGEGGLVVTNDTQLWKKAWEYKDHGKNWDLLQQVNKNGSFRYVHDTFGTNWRMTEMQAAIGRKQLGFLSSWLDKRRANACALKSILENCAGLKIQNEPAYARHAYYKFYVEVENDCLAPGWSRDRIIYELRKEDVPVGSGSCSEIYKEKAFNIFGQQPTLPVAERLGQSSLAFDVHPNLTVQDMEAIGKRVLLVMSKALQNQLSDSSRAA